MNVLMPQLGETVKEGRISTWFKAAGDWVDTGENLFEIETDKVSMEVQALESGRLSEIRVAAGHTAPVGAVVAVIGAGEPIIVPDAAGNKTAATAAPAAPARRSPGPEPGRRPAMVAERRFAPFNEVFTPTQNFGPSRLGELRITPLARRLMAQNGLETAAIAAQVLRKGGRKIVARDVEEALQAPAGHIRESGKPRAVVGERLALNRIRRETAHRLTQAWQRIPHVVQAIEVDFGPVASVRDRQKAGFQERHGVSLSYLPFIARAVCLALSAFPRINAALDEDHLVLRKEINLGIAVDLSHEGLVVPVLTGADGLTVAGLARGLAALVEKARRGQLRPDDLEGGTYSISNNGSFGTLFTAPLINPPQVAILSTDAIRKKPVVVETPYGDAVVARPVGVLAQSFDHRAFDGAYSASFLQKLKEILETRDWAAELA